MQHLHITFAENNSFAATVTQRIMTLPHCFTELTKDLHTFTQRLHSVYTAFHSVYTAFHSVYTASRLAKLINVGFT